MIQDIFPSRLDNSFRTVEMKENDLLLIFDRDGRLLVKENDGRMIYVSGSDVMKNGAIYLFSIDERRYFLLPGYAMPEGDYHYITMDYRQKGFEYFTIREIRDKFYGESMTDVFAAFTAYHLWKWYSDNQYCGRCGDLLERGDKERSLICPKCANVIYPRINPAVIVGVTKGDSILLTRYRRGYAHNALVAGFTEIGETLEETVAREVMEETGVKVKNIRYYKSQPWGMAQDILVGFFCDADGDGEIHMDEKELKYAEWVKREDIELQSNNLSLTNEMMKVFRDNKL